MSQLDPTDGGFLSPMMQRKTMARPASQFSNRLPFFNWVPNGFRPHFIACCGEFVGTWLFLFLAFSGTQVANTTHDGQVTATTTTNTVLFVALVFGFSLAVNAWVFFRISGGLFNPAVTLGMCLVGAVSWLRGGLLLVAQLLGAIASAAVVDVLFPGPLVVATNLSAGTSTVQGLFIEMFLTAELVFTIFMLAAEKHKATFIAPVGIGLALFVAELTGVYFTGGSLNPARSFAPNVVLHNFQSYHWIYWVGPALGAILAAGFYKFMKMLEYETANPGQDEDDREAHAFDPEKDAPATDFASTAMPTNQTSRTGSLKQQQSNARANRNSRGDDHVSNGVGNPDYYQFNGQLQHPQQQQHQLQHPQQQAPPDTYHNRQPLSNQQVNTAAARRIQDNSAKRHSRSANGRSSGEQGRPFRPRPEHQWVEGYNADADGQRAYI